MFVCVHVCVRVCVCVCVCVCDVCRWMMVPLVRGVLSNKPMSTCMACFNCNRPGRTLYGLLLEMCMCVSFREI